MIVPHLLAPVAAPSRVQGDISAPQGDALVWQGDVFDAQGYAIVRQGDTGAVQGDIFAFGQCNMCNIVQPMQRGPEQ